MNRPRPRRPRSSRPTDWSPGPSQAGFEFLLWRRERLAAKAADERILADVHRRLEAERPGDQA